MYVCLINTLLPRRNLWWNSALGCCWNISSRGDHCIHLSQVYLATAIRLLQDEEGLLLSAWSMLSPVTTCLMTRDRPQCKNQSGCFRHPGFYSRLWLLQRKHGSAVLGKTKQTMSTMLRPCGWLNLLSYIPPPPDLRCWGANLETHIPGRNTLRH